MELTINTFPMYAVEISTGQKQAGKINKPANDLLAVSTDKFEGENSGIRKQDFIEYLKKW